MFWAPIGPVVAGAEAGPSADADLFPCPRFLIGGGCIVPDRSRSSRSDGEGSLSTHGSARRRSCIPERGYKYGITILKNLKRKVILMFLFFYFLTFSRLARRQSGIPVKCKKI